MADTTKFPRQLSQIGNIVTVACHCHRTGLRSGGSGRRPPGRSGHGQMGRIRPGPFRPAPASAIFASMYSQALNTPTTVADTSEAALLAKVEDEGGCMGAR